MEIGLYRDGGLAVIDQTPQKMENIKKRNLQSVRQKLNLRITIEANKKVVNFLDVTLDLITEEYKPYSKPTYHSALYVHSKSNHPLCIIKNIPKAINKILSKISSEGKEAEEHTVPVKGTAALHARKVRALHAHYTQCPRSVHAPYTQIHINACNYTHVISRSRHDIACKITRSRSTGTV